jgi:probable HAF family extracellular repeat protein
MFLCMSVTVYGNGVLAAATPEPASTATTAPWKACANEDHTCSFPDTRLVRYGANDRYFQRSLTGPVACSNAVFGDPVPGVDKSCSFLNDPPVPDTWTYCGAEATAEICAFFGTRLVRYGASGSYVYKTATRSIRCTTPLFSADPAVGVDKTCSYASDDMATASSEWTSCAPEDEQCNLSGTTPIRYGADATFVYKTVSGPFQCSNTVFGDPLPTVDKSCSQLAHASPAPGENWTVVDLGSLGGSGTTVADINDSGAIVGASLLANGKQHAFLYHGGLMSDLGTLAGDDTSRAVAINNAGTVLGLSGIETDGSIAIPHVFLADGSGLRGIAMPFEGRYVPIDINDQGDMLINYQTNRCGAVCALVGRSDGSFIDLGTRIPQGAGINNAGTVIAYSGNSLAWTTLYNIHDGTTKQIGQIANAPAGVVNTSPSGWNNLGQVVGMYGYTPPEPNAYTAYLYRDGIASEIQTLVPADIRLVSGINDNGDLIGYLGARDNELFFLYENGSKALITLNDLPAVKNGNWQLDELRRINGARQIIGYAINQDGERRAILLTPQ